MRPALVVRAAARREIEAGAAWYAVREPDLGLAFVQEVESTLGRIERAPQEFARVNGPEPYRRALVGRFPYHVFFEVLEDRAVVIAVAHERRRPGYWLPRSRASGGGET